MNEHASSQRPNDVLFAELHRLTTGLREQTISAGDAQRLESLVCTNPAARDLYLLLTLESLELSRWARQPALSAADLACSAWDQETEVESRLRRIWEAAYDFISNYTTLAALVSGLFVTTVVLSLALWPVPESKLAAPAADVPSTEFVARISGSQQATFDATSDGNFQNRDLFEDDKIVLNGGQVVITYDTGARVVLKGPATYQIQGANGGDLRLGKLVARVEAEHAQGFRVTTPVTVIEDLGTEFAVAVAADGNTDLHVYEGMVRLGEGKGLPGQVVQAGKSFQVATATDGEIAVSAITQVESRFADWMDEVTHGQLPHQARLFWDTYVDQNQPELSFADSDVLLVKRYHTRSGFNREAWICFDLKEVDVDRLADAQLILTVAPGHSSGAAAVSAWQFEVLGLSSEALDGSDVSQLSWNAIRDLSSQRVAAFSVPGNAPNGTQVIAAGTPLVNFLRASNGVPVVLIVRRTTIANKSDYVNGFSSSEREGGAPSLRFSYE